MWLEGGAGTGEELRVEVQGELVVALLVPRVGERRNHLPHEIDVCFVGLPAGLGLGFELGFEFG